MSGTREKGKIAHGEWSKIVARYRAGETIAQIGRDYGCTPPAIRYIIKRTGALRGAAGGEGAVPASANARVRTLPAAEDVVASPAPTSRFARTTPQDRVLGAELRERVTGDIASFLVALDQVLFDDSTRSAASLQEATDRLMRSTARIRLELERLLAGEQAPPRARAPRAQTLSSARGA